jgi:hypothetical protein
MKEIVGIVIATLIAMVGIVGASDMVFTEHINRPGNFAFTDTASMEGWNEWSHQSMASAGGFMSESQFKTLDVPDGAAPEEKSFEQMTLYFTKEGQIVDPLVGEEIDTDITVGTVDNVKPEFLPNGDITGDPNARYDMAKYNMQAFVQPLRAVGGGAKGVSSQLLSSQDDYIHVRGFDSAGNIDPVETSFTDVIIPSDSQAYRQFNWQDSRVWTPDDTANGVWDIQNLIDYQMYDIEFNYGK